MHDATKLVATGRALDDNYGVVNPAVYRASTITYPTMRDLLHGTPARPCSYGRNGTPTVQALERAVAEIEGGARSIAVSSGKAAVNATLLSLLSPGDHLLMVDAAYQPTRALCNGLLARMGIETTFYDPLIGTGIGALIRPNTKVVFTESPGSQTFEMQDIPAIAEAAHARGCLVVMDNTWASPLLFKPFAHGVDVAIQAATKYIVGHSDVMLGTITTTAAMAERMVKGVRDLAYSTSPDDAYLALRGLRTMGVRLRQHQENALVVARWLQEQPEVVRVMYPALADDPGHALWRRDFLGASGLFGVELRPFSLDALAAMLDHLEFFAMGFSWGGYESLIVPTFPAKNRTAVPWRAEGPTLRLHIGLEEPQDLIADLAEGLTRLRQHDAKAA